VRIVAASHNEGKREQFAKLLREVGAEAIIVDDLPDPEEGATTFLANAALKASSTAAHTGQLSLADDTGLVIADLPGGGPGIRSRLVAEKFGGWREAMEAIVSDAGLLADPRALVKAHFVCAMAVSHPDGSTWSRKATVDGRLRWPPLGDGPGFVPIFSPYDPLWIDGVLSHRRHAFDKLWPAVEAANK
jgi:XTP/dITP diphosphohydrolase